MVFNQFLTHFLPRGKERRKTQHFFINYCSLFIVVLSSILRIINLALFEIAGIPKGGARQMGIRERTFQARA